MIEIFSFKSKIHQLYASNLVSKTRLSISIIMFSLSDI